jgi:hypothetical protein
MTDDDGVSFARDIRPLFRDRDLQAMAFAFDLSSYDEVREHASDIYSRLADGSMPCDGAWLAEDLRRFKAWIDGGAQP